MPEDRFRFYEDSVDSLEIYKKRINEIEAVKCDDLSSLNWQSYTIPGVVGFALGMLIYSVVQK